MPALTQTVREIALEQPSSIRVFEQFGIDYCCGGRKPLTDACAEKNVDYHAVLTALEKAETAEEPTAEDWTKRSLAGLSAYIVATHHEYCKTELPRLAGLAARVVNRHGASRPELPTIQSKLAQLTEELTEHLAKEEIVLFPYISKLERSIAEGSSKPHGCFGTVAHPVAMMVQEHDAAGMLIAEIRALSGDFKTPEGACPTYHAFYDGLRGFEKDLHQHVHLENNILFPRAIELEASCN